MDTSLDLLQQATMKLSQCGSIKDRLAEAYATHLVQVDINELPEHVRGEFGRLCEAMQRERPLPHETAIRASVRKMSNDEAQHYAALVVRLFATLARTGSAAIVVPGRRSARANANVAPIARLFATDA
jgi:hypothetical protein